MSPRWNPISTAASPARAGGARRTAVQNSKCWACTRTADARVDHGARSQVAQSKIGHAGSPGAGGDALHWRSCDTHAQVEPGDPVLVIGAGPIGLSTIQFAQLAERCRRDGDERQADGICATSLGIDQWVDGRQDPVPQLQALHGGELPSPFLTPRAM